MFSVWVSLQLAFIHPYTNCAINKQNHRNRQPIFRQFHKFMIYNSISVYSPLSTLCMETDHFLTDDWTSGINYLATDMNRCCLSRNMVMASLTYKQNPIDSRGDMATACVGLARSLSYAAIHNHIPDAAANNQPTPISFEITNKSVYSDIR